VLLDLLEVADRLLPRASGMKVVEPELQQLLAAITGKLLGTLVGVDHPPGRYVEQKMGLQPFLEADAVQPSGWSGDPGDTPGLVVAADGTRGTLHDQSFSQISGAVTSNCFQNDRLEAFQKVKEE
jgi:hypothetical protein